MGQLTIVDKKLSSAVRSNEQNDEMLSLRLKSLPKRLVMDYEGCSIWACNSHETYHHCICPVNGAIIAYQLEIASYHNQGGEVVWQQRLLP